MTEPDHYLMDTIRGEERGERRKESGVRIENLGVGIEELGNRSQ